MPLSPSRTLAPRTSQRPCVARTSWWPPWAEPRWSREGMYRACVTSQWGDFYVYFVCFSLWLISFRHHVFCNLRVPNGEGRSPMCKNDLQLNYLQLKSYVILRCSWLKPGAVVIDVGINSVDDPTSKKGKADCFWLLVFFFPKYRFVQRSYHSLYHIWFFLPFQGTSWWATVTSTNAKKWLPSSHRYG